jgi:hypothetical protein
MLKNICHSEHSGHRETANFITNLLPALAAYCFFLKALPSNLKGKDNTDN